MAGHERYMTISTRNPAPDRGYRETCYPVEEDTYGLPTSKGGLSPVTGFTRPPA
jgi:hypothetical protein